jgi:hypothetical protein
MGRGKGRRWAWEEKWKRKRIGIEKGRGRTAGRQNEGKREGKEGEGKEYVKRRGKEGRRENEWNKKRRAKETGGPEEVEMGGIAEGGGG